MSTTKKSFSVFEVVVGISTIIACIAAVFVVPEVRRFAGLDSIKSTETIVEVIPTKTSRVTQSVTLANDLIPIQTGKASIDVYIDVGSANSTSYSFEEATSSPSKGPDLVLEQCNCDGSFGSCPKVRCVLRAAEVWQLGNVPLNTILNLDNTQSGCSGKLFFPTGSCALDVGDAFAIITYSGHLAKFRITQVDIAWNHTGASFKFEWVYQPNDRMDFEGP